MDLSVINAAKASGDLAIPPPGCEVWDTSLDGVLVVKYATKNGDRKSRIALVGEQIPHIWAVDEFGSWNFLYPITVARMEIRSIPEGSPPFDLWPRLVERRIGFFVDLPVHGWWFNGSCANENGHRWGELTPEERDAAISVPAGVR